MDEEQAFLDEITAQPGDRLLRLIYADWLEEAGDPRAELIRVEEEMRTVPIASDRFWELKPRRNLYRKALDPAWLARMRYGNDYEPVFRVVPADWKGRWRVIREFVERWYGLPMGDVGGGLEEVRAIEGRLDRTLPPSIREWIAFVSDVSKRDSEYVLRDVAGVEDVALIDSISLMIQGEGDYHWAVDRGDLAIDDPPVFGHRLDYDVPEESWFPDGRFSPSVTGFVMRYLALYLHITRCVGSFKIDAVGESVEAELAPCFSAGSSFDELRIFEETNRIAVVSPPWMSIGPPDLGVFVKKEDPRGGLPSTLRELARRSRNADGILAPARNLPGSPGRPALPSPGAGPS
jgi:uncharacterized protein (TIGR02996 family)